MSETKATPEIQQVETEAVEVAVTEEAAVEKAVAPVEEAAETAVEAPVEAAEEPAATEAPVEEAPAATDAPVEEASAATEAPAEETPAEYVPSMDEFEAEIDASLVKIRRGDVMDCTVISVGEEEIVVSFGYAADGIIRKHDLLVEEGQAIADAYKVEDQIKAEVLKKDDGEGNVLLSEKRAVQVIVWDELESHFKEKTRFKVTVKEVVKGGVVAMIKGIRAFMPASMVSSGYVEDLNEFVGQELEVIVKDFDRKDRKVIISHKEIDKEKQRKVKKSLFEDIQVDQVFTGKVKKLMNFGAFVDIGGVDGLVHINEMSWKRIKHPSEVMKEGDKIEVVVLKVDRAKEKISLGLKSIDNNPWNDMDAHFKTGKVYEGEVVRLTGFGAFVRIAEGVEGLVHVSEIDHKRIDTPASVLEVGQKVKVKVLKVDSKGQKISLSIKATKEDENAVDLDKYTTNEEATTSLESVFKDILKDLK